MSTDRSTAQELCAALNDKEIHQAITRWRRNVFDQTFNLKTLSVEAILVKRAIHEHMDTFGRNPKANEDVDLTLQILLVHQFIEHPESFKMPLITITEDQASLVDWFAKILIIVGMISSVPVCTISAEKSVFSDALAAPPPADQPKTPD